MRVELISKTPWSTEEMGGMAEVVKGSNLMTLVSDEKDAKKIQRSDEGGRDDFLS